MTTTQIVINATRIFNHLFLKAHCISFQNKYTNCAFLGLFLNINYLCKHAVFTLMCFAFLCKGIKMSRFTAFNNFHDYFKYKCTFQRISENFRKQVNLK